jgi:hypothetical protein
VTHHEKLASFAATASTSVDMVVDDVQIPINVSKQMNVVASPEAVWADANDAINHGTSRAEVGDGR